MRDGRLRWMIVGIGALILMQCSGKKYSFEKITCYDRPHMRTIYTPCRQFMYNVKFWDQEYNLISESRVLVSMTGEAFASYGAEQIEGVYQYEYLEEEIPVIEAFNINKSMPDSGWVHQLRQSLSETPTDVWMTPFRQNQFAFTQVSPYPSVSLPLENGKQWTSNLIMYDGWGDWDNQQLISNYEAVEQVPVEVPYGTLDNVWHVNAYVEMNLGINQLDFWFDQRVGFVKMIYKNYAGQLLQFELIEVIEMGG